MLVLFAGCATIARKQMVSNSSKHGLYSVSSSDTVFDQAAPEGSDVFENYYDAGEPEEDYYYYYPYSRYYSSYYRCGPYPYYYDPFYCGDCYYDPFCSYYGSMYAPYYYGYPYYYYYDYDDDDHHHRTIDDIIEDWRDYLDDVRDNISDALEARKEARRDFLENLNDRIAHRRTSLQKQGQDLSVDALDIAQRMREVRQHQREAVRHILNNHTSYTGSVLRNSSDKNSVNRLIPSRIEGPQNQRFYNNRGFIGNRNHSVGGTHKSSFGNGSNSVGIFGGGGGFRGWGGRR